MKTTCKRILLLLAGLTLIMCFNTKGWSIPVLSIKVATFSQVPQENWVIKGQIVDPNNKPLPGVTIKIGGTAMGCASDNEGNFSLKVFEKTGTLNLSFVGYKSQKVTYKVGTILKIKMEEDVASLDEVTIVAYGKQSKRQVTGAVSTISDSELAGTSPNFLQMIQGAAPGVDIKRISNSPGGGGNDIEIRGRSGLAVERNNRNTGPLFIVDGFQLFDNVSSATGQSSIVDINPEDIKTMTVLKDASATSLYGSRAANGVIVITTKKGGFNQKAKGSLKFSYIHEFNPPLPDLIGGHLERITHLEALKNLQEAVFDPEKNQYVYINNYEDSYKNKLHYDYFWNKGNISHIQALQDSLNPYYNNSTNIYDYYFQNGKTYEGNLQVNGGSNNIAYFVSLNYYNQDKAILKNTGFNRLKLASNLQIKVRDNFKIELITDISRTGRRRAVTLKANFPSDLIIEKIPSELLTYSTLLPGPGSPLFEATIKNFNETKEKLESYRLRSGLTASWEIISGLELKSSFAIDYTQGNSNTFYPSTLDEYGESNSIGQVERNLSWMNENLLTYSWTNNSHYFDILLGASFQADERNLIKGWGKNAPTDLIHYVSWYSQVYDQNAQRDLKDFYTEYTKSTLVGFFGRINYNWLQKYLVSMTLRRDASSKFGENVRWATFPSFSVGYAFSEENFMTWSKSFLDYGKIRASWGKSGRQFSQPYVAYGVLNPGTETFLGNPTIVPEWWEGLENRKLTWEEASQFDIGVDLELLNKRISLVFDYYYKYTDKILYNITLPGNYSGFSKQWQNAYAISNRGIEFQIKWNIIRNDKWFWDITLNAASNKNRLEKSALNRDFQITSSNTGENFSNNLNVVGRPINGIYAFKTSGIYQNQEEVPYTFLNGRKIYLYGNNLKQFYRPGDRIFTDVDGNGNIITSRPAKEDRIYIGSPIPKVTGGINTNLRWKKLDLSISTFFSLGSYALNMRKGASLGTSMSNPVTPIFAKPDDLNYWKEPGDNSNLPANRADASLNNFATNISANVEKVNFLKIRSLTVGYQLPTVYGFESKLSFTAENFFTWTNYSGADPETIDPVTGIDDLANYPIGKIFKIKLDINF